MSNTQTTELKKGVSVKAPKTECKYLTSYKDYVVKKVLIDDAFLIKDDNGEKLFCKLSDCGHLNGMDWILNN